MWSGLKPGRCPGHPRGLRLWPARGALWGFPSDSAHEEEREAPPLPDWARESRDSARSQASRCGSGEAAGIGPRRRFLFCCYLDTDSV